MKKYQGADKRIARLAELSSTIDTQLRYENSLFCALEKAIEDAFNHGGAAKAADEGKSIIAELIKEYGYEKVELMDVGAGEEEWTCQHLQQYIIDSIVKEDKGCHWLTDTIFVELEEGEKQ